MSASSIAFRTLAVQPHPSAAEVITNDLSALIEDGQALLRVIGDLTQLSRRGMLTTTQESGAVPLQRLHQELALVRSVIRHLQHQARNEGLDICDLCGTARTTAPTTAGAAATCIACRRER